MRGFNQDRSAPIQEPPRVTSLVQKMVLSPRKLHGLCVKNQGQRLTIRTKDAPSTLVAQEGTRDLGALFVELGAETKCIYFLLCHRESEG